MIIMWIMLFNALSHSIGDANQFGKYDIRSHIIYNVHKSQFQLHENVLQVIART